MEIRRMQRGLVISLVIAAGTAAWRRRPASPCRISSRWTACPSSPARARHAAGVHGQHARPRGEPAAHRHLDRRCQGRRSAGPPDRRPGQRYQPGVERGRADHLLPVVAQRLVQVWRMPGSQAGEATQVTKYPLDVGAFACRPMAGSSRSRSRSTSTAPTSRAPPSGTPRPRKEGHRPALRFPAVPPLGHLEGRPALAPLRRAGGASATRPRVDVMKGMDADARPSPSAAPRSSPSPRTARASSSPRATWAASEAWSTDLDLFLAPIDGSQKPRKLTAENRATDTGPVFSPGRQDARVPRDGAPRLRGRPAARHAAQLAGRARSACSPSGWDRSAGELAGGAGRQGALRTAGQDVGQQSRLRDRRGHRRAKAPAGQGHATAAAAGPAAAVVYSRRPARARRPVCRARADGRHAGPAHPLQRRGARRRRLGDSEQFSFPGWNGETVHGYVVKPAGFDPASTRSRS